MARQQLARVTYPTASPKKPDALDLRVQRQPLGQLPCVPPYSSQFRSQRIDRQNKLQTLASNIQRKVSASEI
jgi:hypothetical protein